jgi:hypothetical protein
MCFTSSRAISRTDILTSRRAFELYLLMWMDVLIYFVAGSEHLVWWNEIAAGEKSERYELK